MIRACVVLVIAAAFARQAHGRDAEDIISLSHVEGSAKVATTAEKVKICVLQHNWPAERVLCLECAPLHNVPPRFSVRRLPRAALTHFSLS